MTPYEFIKNTLGNKITFDNESDDCDLTWSQVADLMSEFSKLAEQSEEQICPHCGSKPKWPIVLKD